MKTKSRRSSKFLIVAITAGSLLAFTPLVHAAPPASASTLKSALHGPNYQNVQVSVDPDGIATLSGTVKLYEYKADAAKIARDQQGVEGVRNHIQVSGDVSDAAIEKKLAPELAYSREGYGSVFDAITLKVENGVVTLGGHAHNYPDRDAAVAYAATTPGVKDVIDDIQVDPVSPMDWRIRMKVARAIYGDPAFQKYAIDPIRPIRISVQGGRVELYGTVDSKMDKQLAFMRANAVPGVFSVQNHLRVQGQPSPKSESEQK